MKSYIWDSVRISWDVFRFEPLLICRFHFFVFQCQLTFWPDQVGRTNIKWRSSVIGVVCWIMWDKLKISRSILIVLLWHKISKPDYRYHQISPILSKSPGDERWPLPTLTQHRLEVASPDTLKTWHNQENILNMLNILKCMAVNPTCQVVPKVATAELQDLPFPSLSLEHVEHLGGGEVTWGVG